MMNETQQTVGEWAVDAFGPGPLTPRHCIRLLEEVIELCIAAGATTDEIDAAFYASAGEAGNGKPESAKVSEELADCAIVLDTLAHRAGVSLQAEKDAKMARNRKRSWKVMGDGTGYHTAEPDDAAPAVAPAPESAS